MRKITCLIAIVLIISLGFVQNSVAEQVKRIVSLLPSATEMLFAVGEGENVVGVTRYCRYPQEAQSKPQVGGILDTNYEVIFKLQPDLVVITSDADEQKERLETMGLKTLVLETKTVAGILDSIRKVGVAVNKVLEANDIADDIEKKFANVREKTQNLPKPKVLITYLRPLGEGHIREVYIAGDKTYFNEIIEASGGVNAFQGTDRIVSPVVTPEGILQMNPDVIIELMSSLDSTQYSVDDVKKDWDMLPELNAHKNERIHIITSQYINIPGPRLGQVLEDIARVIHPEIFKN